MWSISNGEGQFVKKAVAEVHDSTSATVYNYCKQCYHIFIPPQQWMTCPDT